MALPLFALCILSVSSYLLSAFVFAQNDRAFRPETESIHVFPSFVESSSWHNIDTLGIQDLDENALFQEFDVENSAYIDPEGVLPGESVQSGDVSDVEPDTRETESTDTEIPNAIPAVTEDASSTSGSLFASSSQILLEEEPPALESDVVESVESEVVEVEMEASSVEPETEPVPVEQEQESETVNDEPLSLRESISSFFRDFLGTYAFAETVTTTPAVSDEVVSGEQSVLLETSHAVSTTTTNLDSISLDDSNTTTPTTNLEETGIVAGDDVISNDSDESASTTSDRPNVPYDIVLRDFGVPSLESGQFIENLQLRLSLGAQYEADASSTIPSLSATYTFGDFSGDAGSILVEDEISNAVNGGYYLIPLPSVSDPTLLSDLEITLTFDGDIERLGAFYIDAIWLEVGTVVYDKDVLMARSAPSRLDHLKSPEHMEYLGDKLDFTRDEVPQFSFRYNSQRNVAVRAVRSVFGRDLAEVTEVRLLHGGLALMPIHPDVTVTSDGLITILLSEEDRATLKPGTYSVEVTVDEGGYKSVDSFDFQWGVLSVNTNQTEYGRGDIAEISLGALTPNGNTLCNAILDLYVIDPRGFISKEPVVPSGECNGNNVIDVPDYSAQFVTDIPGEYEIYVERLDEMGGVIGHTGDTFHVVSRQDKVIERNGPTRIYPPAPYAMELTVHAKQNGFNGTLVERLPRGFDVFNTDATINRYADFTELVWDVSLLASTSETVSYEFDAPDLSPYLYELGPARLVDEDADSNERMVVATTSSSTIEAAPTSTTFEEHRQWQIASDATGNMILFYDGATIPSGWSCLSCGSGTFFQRFVMGSSTYNTTGGTATHTPSASASVLASSAASTENTGGTTIDATSHSHTLTPTIATASNLPRYRQLRVIQYTGSAGEPDCLGGDATCIPVGAIGIFDVASSSLPTDWYQYDAQDGYYIRGEDTVGTTGGSNTHAHAITGTTSASAGSTYGNRGPDTADGAAAGHTHTISSSTVSINSEPPYVEVLFARLGATSSPPNDLISLWTEDVPSGWLNLSDEVSDPFSNRFIKASSTYGSSGGASSHTHADVSGILSSAPSAIVTNARLGIFGSASTHQHTVNVTSFSTTSNLPPYVTAVVGKRAGTDPIYTQESFRWYTNQNAQTPTDPWPSGATNLGEGVAISTSTTLVKNTDVIRLRMNLSVQNATSSAGAEFKLQYAATNACSSGTWFDVGNTSSSSVWRGYNNTSVTDHTTLSSTTLASTTVAETYEENGYSTTTPSDISVGDFGEWDFVLQQNGALAGTNYCFRLVESDGTPFFGYTNYAQLYTNRKPDAPTMLTLFDNEKTPTTTPVFTFVAVDPESEDVHYQIQVDDDFAFGSTIMDESTVSNSTDFENLVTPSDKAPYNDGEEMQFTSNTALTNGTTYWWRVRSRDSGSGEWSNWTTARSFTVDTTLSATAWFQTTEEQFDTDTRSGVESLGTDEVDLITGSTTGTLTSTAIDFTDGTLGTAWGSLEWNDTETVGDIKYSVEYQTDASTWSLIPDSDLAGNSTGFDASPVSLLNLDADTYTVIRIVADFTNAGGSPSLQDWTVNWGYRVETPTITKLFPNEKTGTTTPTFEFTTSDPQDDDLTYEISWSTDNTFVSASTTRISSSSAGFINADNGGDSDPFFSGDTIQFTIQPVDALSNDTTYWWRVRATDPNGSNNFSLWTSPQSFTVATDTIVSTWFQTTEEQFDTNILSGTIALPSDVVTVATTASEALIVYGEGTETVPRYRQWNGSTWGSEGSLQDVGAPLRWAVVRAGSQREEYVAGTIGTDADLNLQVFSTGAWGNLQEVTSNTGDINARGFDIAYESNSGDAIVAFCDGDADPSYYVWNGSSWTAGAGPINLASANNCEWIKLASDPTSDEIVLLSGDAAGSQFEAQVWNGSAWGNSTTLGGIVDQDHEGLAVQYEESGGQALIVVSDGAPARFRWDSWNGTAWAGASTQAIGDDFEWGELVADVGSDEMALCYQDEDTNIGMVRWTGSAWAGQVELLTTTGKAKNDPGFSCVFEDGGSRDNYIVTAYTDTTATNYSFWNNTAWSTGAPISSLGDTITSRLIRTGVGDILGTFFDETNDSLFFYEWDGTSWTSTTTIEDNMSVGTSPYGHPYALAPRGDGKTGTTIVSPGINFTDGVGPYWEEMSWVDTTPGTSDILYSVQYWDGDSWEFIPDIDLPGNTAGTSTSPIDLSGLNITTYDRIRPYASLSCDDSSNCPTLSDWTVKWAEGITIQGTLQGYDQSTNINSGTIAVAVNGVLQVGKIGAVSGGAWSIPNVTTFAGDVITVFVSDTTDSTEAVGVARYDGIGDITGMQLYERHLTLGSDSATTTPLTNTDVTLYNAGNDEDVFIDSNGSALQVCADAGCFDAELYINASTTFTPGGNVVVHDIENNGTFVATTTLYISGSWDNNATTTMTSSNVIFEATSTTETVDGTGATAFSFNNVTFGTTTGSATWTLASLLDVNGNLTALRGTLSRGTTEITIAGNLLTGTNGYWAGIGTTTFDGSGSNTWSDQNAVLQNVGNVVVDSSLKTITLAGNVAAESITINANDTLDASAVNYDITVYGDWRNSGTFIPRNGTVFMSATSSGIEITAGGDAFYDLTFNGVGGDWAFTESELTVSNDFTIATGTVTMPTATTTIAGSFSSIGGIFAHSNAAIEFTSASAETIAASGTQFTNAFFNLSFNGSGSWTFLDTNATSSGDVTVSQGSVTFPAGDFTIGGSLRDEGGSWNPNNGTVRLVSTGAESILAGGSSFFNLETAGSGSWTFTDTNAVISNDLSVLAGTLVLPSGTLSLGGSLTNTAIIDSNSGTIRFDSTDAGETIDTGSSDLYDVVFDSVTGGWTITAPATTTNNFLIGTTSVFTLASGQTLTVGGVFTNSVGGASTTWTGSTIRLTGGTYSINEKTTTGDTYGTLSVDSSAGVSVWNSSASTVTTAGGGYLYSMDHAGTDGALNIYGDYQKTSGNEYWSYATDFDGVDLSGGSERQAIVGLAGGATVALSDVTFEALGISTASTTIDNLGSGTYTIDVTGGTTTAQYYEFADLGLTGVSFLGGAIVPVLRDGSYSVGVDTGSALTLSSTTIDANPAKQIFNVVFATTTAIGAINVTQTDGAPVSYWWFRNGSGNLHGETYDNDTGDPGSVRFDDSSLQVNISGTVYLADEVTPHTIPECNGILTPIRLVVDGGTTYDTACSPADGSFTFSNVTVVGDPVLTAFINSDGGAPHGVTVSKTPTGNITGFDIYRNHVIVRHEDTEPMTIADMAVYDSSDDSDIHFTAATGTADTLVLDADYELHVWATTTFTPGGSVTLSANATGNSYDGTLHLGNDATFVGAGTTTYTVGGSLNLESGATFVPASTTVVMNATTTGKTINTVAGEVVNFHELQFTGVGGGWNINGNASTTNDIYVATGTVTGTGDITIDNGSFYGDGLVSLGGGAVVIEDTNTLGGTQGWTFNNLTLGTGATVGTTTPASTATTTVGGVLTIGTAHFLDAGASSWNLSGSGGVFVENGTFLEDTSRVTYSGSAATDITSTDYYNLNLDAFAGSPTYTAVGLGIQIFGDLTVGNTATTTVTFDTNDTALNVDGDMTIGTLGTFVGSNSGSFTIAGSYDNNGVFTGSGGTLIFDGSGTHTIAAGQSSFSSVDINGGGDFTVTEHATATNAWTLTAANDFTVASGQTLAVGGTFTNEVGGADTVWTGATLFLYGGGNYEINASTTADTYDTLRVDSGTQIRMWNSSASTTTALSGGSLYSMDHAGSDGVLTIYGDYSKTSGTDFWSYATDFDGTSLGGGSERLADVSVLGGGSVSYAGTGGLFALGTAGASTTVGNQGAGTYSFDVAGSASTTFQYYQLRDMDSDGLTLSGTPTINNLSNGDFEAQNNNDTTITVFGTVITANPAKTFSENRFGTSSGVSTAVNVTATGTTVSSWRFTNHYGDIDGESFDSDPDGDPGYIAWDDSAANISISGRVYSDEGSTVSSVCDGSTQVILVRVAGLTTYQSSCDGGGLYSVSGVTYSPGDSIIAYINGTSSKGATVTVDPVSNIGNMDIYENRVIVRHESTDPISIVDMAAWDSSDDADIPFTAVDSSPDTLTLPANRKLIVWTGKEFAPGGNVTLAGGGGGAAYDGTLELYANADWTSAAGQVHSIGGSLISGAGATFDVSTAQFTFTTSGSSRTIDTNDAAFADVVFNGTGSWTVTNTTLDTNDLTITQGTVTLPAATTTISGTLNNTGGSFDANGGTMVFDSSASENITAGGSDFATLSIDGSGSFAMQDTNATATESVIIENGTLTLVSGTFAVGGDFRNIGGAITHNTSLLYMTATTTATLLASSSDLYGVTFAGGGTYSMEDNSLTLLDDLFLTSGSLTLASGTLAIGGSFDASGGSFDNATGSILFNSTDTGETIDSGNSDFYNVTFGNGAGGWTITSHATTTNNLTLATASDFTLASGQTLTVGGVFTNNVGGSATTWIGSTLRLISGTEYAINNKTTGDEYETLFVGDATDISSWNSRATTTTVAASGSLYSQDHDAVDGDLYIFGDYHIATTTEYWSYATDFDGVSLVGGSERAVLVRIGSGATTTVDGGTLNIAGSVGNETTITNQGSGTYSFNVSEGTLSAQYYAFRNLDASGLSLTGTPTISTLNYGDFELAVNGGNLISLASSTLNANASLVITGARFATTTAITGTNVYLTGTTASAWTFTSHTGNLDGEDFDVDGGSACGQVRWDDSSCLLTQQTHYRWRYDDGGIDVPSAEWYDANWDARQRVRLTNSDATTYTDAAVELTVVYDADMQSDFDDLRFTDSSGTTTIPYFVASTTGGVSAEVWVQVPSLAAQDTTHIFMYYNNATASSTSSSTEVFVAADDFEDGNISEYSGDTSLFEVDGGHAYGGSYGLDNTANNEEKATDGIARFDQTVSQGETFEYRQYIDTSGGQDEVCTMFGVQSPVTNNSNYGICIEQVLGNNDYIAIVEDVAYAALPSNILASSSITVSTGWHEIEVDWGTDDSIFVSLYDESGTLLATTTATDNSKTSGGFGFTYWFNNGGWDNMTSRPTLQNEPAVLFGVEQVDGGANWAQAQDTRASFVIGDTARLRFAVENTGLSVSDAYRLEFAEKGAAPSCEAVDPTSFGAVSPYASCGTDPVCMATSTTVANGANTTDLLLVDDGDFTAGKFVEDTSNTSASLTVDQNEYTEVEYAITITPNITDQGLCFRVSDAGSDLDTYLKVAEMQIPFDPLFGAVTFNLGQDISLVGGTTTRVYATSTVTDLNGYTDLVAATATMYTTSATAACTADDNDCYIGTYGSQCSFTNCAGNSCVLECYADFWYHATPTASDAGEEWFAFLEAEDSAGGSDFNTSMGIELYELRAIASADAINYGSLEVSQDTGATNASTSVENVGNVPIDIDIDGSDLSDGGSSVIPAGQQLVSSTTFTYSSCIGCYAVPTSTPITVELDLSKPTTSSSVVQDDVYWGIAIPFGTASNVHTGNNNFTPIDD